MIFQPMGAIRIKLCSKCGELKPLSDYHADKYKKDGVKSRCAECCRNDRVEWRNKNIDKAKEQEKAQYHKHREMCMYRTNLWRKENPEKAKAIECARYERDREKRIKASCDWNKANRDKVNERNREWYKKTNDKRRAYFAQKRNDPAYRVEGNLRRRLNSLLSGKTKGDSFSNILGCSNIELKAYIELMFTDGMTWDNYGEWHIDHIMPCSKFDLSDVAQQKECFNYTNLQPLWARDNLRKGDRVVCA
jgi:hypothetical protein